MISAHTWSIPRSASIPRMRPQIPAMCHLLNLGSGWCLPLAILQAPRALHIYPPPTGHFPINIAGHGADHHIFSSLLYIYVTGGLNRHGVDEGGPHASIPFSSHRPGTSSHSAYTAVSSNVTVTSMPLPGHGNFVAAIVGSGLCMPSTSPSKGRIMDKLYFSHWPNQNKWKLSHIFWQIFHKTLLCYLVQPLWNPFNLRKILPRNMSADRGSSHRILTHFEDLWTPPQINRINVTPDDVIKWKHFPRYWPFIRRIHRSPVNSLHKGQRRGAMMFPLICAWINSCANNREAGDLYAFVIIMISPLWWEFVWMHVR